MISMHGMNELLNMIENPTRRRILESLTREPHYPLQLSKELGISQPAIVKHLNLLEEHGLVAKHQENSSKGPKRTVYTPNLEFTLVLDMRNGMFTARLVDPDEECCETEDVHSMDTAIGMMAEIDERISELERMRCEMIRKRESLIRNVLDAMPKGQTVYRHRNLMYDMLNGPHRDIRSISEGMRMNADTIREMIEDIDNILKEERE